MNHLYATPIDFKVRLLTYLNGIEVSRSRELSKHMLAIIDANEAIIYYERMRVEYPKRHLQYYTDCTYRYDWKNVYIITDQYEVSKIRAVIHRGIIEGRKCFEVAEQVMMILETTFNCLSGAFNIIKISVFGFSASREILKLFLKTNPGKTVQDAINAVKGTTTPAITYNVDI